MEERQKTEDTIGIHRNETRSTRSVAWEEKSKPRDMRYTNRIHQIETRSTGSAGELKIT